MKRISWLMDSLTKGSLSSCVTRFGRGLFVVAACLCLGNGVRGEPFPIKVLLAGNWADPTVVRVGSEYYLTANNDEHVPSVMVFYSKDLRNWEPLAYACPNVGQVYATDIAAYGGKLYIYGGGGNNIWATVAEAPYTKWSERVDLRPIKNRGIDAGHIVDDRGKRYLYVSEGQVFKLSGDGLRAVSVPEKVYKGWPIPRQIAIECFCLESPKLFKRGSWYYMVSAQGGTAGPATSHMAVVARSRGVLGPWENSPHNPLIWTRDPTEQWWSKGHATLIEGPDSRWYAVYHGYPNGQRSFGRCTLISPIDWTNDGWPVLAKQWPAGWDGPVSVEWPLGDEFDGDDLARQWQSHGQLDRNRYRLKDGQLCVQAQGTLPGDSAPLTVNPKDLAYEVETELVLEGDVDAGLVLFYSPRAYVGIGLSSDGQLRKHVAKFPDGPRAEPKSRISSSEKRIRMKLVNDRQDASYYYQRMDGEWKKLSQSDDISSFQHNNYKGFVSVRPGIFATGKGKARFSYFRYRALDRARSGAGGEGGRRKDVESR